VGLIKDLKIYVHPITVVCLWNEFLVKHGCGQWKMTLKQKWNEKTHLANQKIKENNEHLVQILSYNEDKSWICAKNNYNEWSKKLKQHSMQLKHKKCKCKCFPWGYNKTHPQTSTIGHPWT